MRLLVAPAHLIHEAVNSKVCRCFVFASSIAVYGKGQVPMTEDMVPQLENPYGIGKYAVELDLKAAHERWGTNTIEVRDKLPAGWES